MTRAVVFAELTRRICAIGVARPVCVAIDGVDAAGKTTFADALVAPIERAGRAVTRLAADDYLNPSEIRYRRGRESPEGFYRDSFDHDAIIAAVRAEARRETIVLVDGVFLLRPELRDLWDVSIFLRTSFAVTVARAVARDAVRLGSADTARALYAARYVPGQQLYFVEAEPERYASVVVDNDDFDHPRIVAQSEFHREKNEKS